MARGDVTQQLVAAGFGEFRRARHSLKVRFDLRVRQEICQSSVLLDLKDDRDTALNLFKLVNAIAEQMISHPKSVNDMYSMLPEGKRNAIEARNAKAKKTPGP